MIQKEELQNLCDLARIGRSCIDEKSASVINGVLGYMKNLEEVIVEHTTQIIDFTNSVRSDEFEIIDDNSRNLLIQNFPESDKSYNKVQKILNKKK